MSVDGYSGSCSHLHLLFYTPNCLSVVGCYATVLLHYVMQVIS